MSYLQFLVWLTLAGILFALVGFWLAERFRQEAKKRQENEEKSWKTWWDRQPTHEGPEYEAAREEHFTQVAEERERSRKAAKRWNWTCGIATYVALATAIWFAAIWVPSVQNNEYDQGWFATRDSFNEGWNLGCEVLMGTSDGGVWYYGNQEFDQQWCENLNQTTQVRDFWWDYRPRRLPEGEPVETYQAMARSAGSNLSIRTAFAAQPVLCDGDECWDWDRMFDHLMGLSLDSMRYDYYYGP